mmetsp:Transcript_8594/g.18156  ORF Transcript_8594/g.18156 Transcript_8594/m.18156 type:complete len:356 (+) Transcript_8594:1956-3023(+)
MLLHPLRPSSPQLSSAEQSSSSSLSHALQQTQHLKFHVQIHPPNAVSHHPLLVQEIHHRRTKRVHHLVVHLPRGSDILLHEHRQNERGIHRLPAAPHHGPRRQRRHLEHRRSLTGSANVQTARNFHGMFVPNLSQKSPGFVKIGIVHPGIGRDSLSHVDAEVHVLFVVIMSVIFELSIFDVDDIPFVILGVAVLKQCSVEGDEEGRLATVPRNGNGNEDRRGDFVEVGFDAGPSHVERVLSTVGQKGGGYRLVYVFVARECSGLKVGVEYHRFLVYHVRVGSIVVVSLASFFNFSFYTRRLIPQRISPSDQGPPFQIPSHIVNFSSNVRSIIPWLVPNLIFRFRCHAQQWSEHSQ